MKLLENLELKRYILLNSDNEVSLSSANLENGKTVYSASATDTYENDEELGYTIKDLSKVLDAKEKIYVINYILKNTLPTGSSKEMVEDILGDLAELYMIVTEN